MVITMGFPGGSAGKNPPASAGDVGLIPGLKRSPSVGNGNPSQNSCFENPMDGGASQKSQTQTWRLNSNKWVITS